MGKSGVFIRILIVSFVFIFAIYFLFLRGNAVSMLLSPIDKKTNFVILGMDEGGRRADSIITGCVNTDEKRISLLSVPRDTLVTVPADRLAVMKRQSSYAPNNGQMKINAVYAYAGEEYGADFTVKQIEELLGVQIKYYILIDLGAFRYIVDGIGGVEYDVPFRMKYTDPAQGLDIDLQPGRQLLNGRQAEGLVRYRKSDDGSHPEYTDINRTQTQQAFIKALAQKIFSDRNLIENASVLIPAMFNYTRSNMDAASAAKYIKYIRQLKDYEIVPNTLAYRDEHRNGASYIIVDARASGDVIESVFGLNGGRAQGSSKGIPVLVLNGGSVSGLAARSKDFLVEKGFTVAGIGDYAGERVTYTRIFVKSDGIGNDIQALYPKSRIFVDESAFDDEIVVVLGLDEK